MALSETEITKAIIQGFATDFVESLELDVAIAGAGPSGVTAAYFLAKQGFKVAVFERNLHVGGGMWGGGMLFPRIVVERSALDILDMFGVKLKHFTGDYYVGDSVETVSKCTASAIDGGARIWVGVSVEDVVIREEDRIAGIVINWRAVELAGMHVDPLAVHSKVVIDASGHDAEIVRNVQRKIPGLRLLTDTGKVIGEKPMWAEVGEAELLDNTREVYPGIIVCGMAANAVLGSPRMGAVFGGMFLSGKKAAEIAADLVRHKT